jgi:hypothetical protein
LIWFAVYAALVAATLVALVQVRSNRLDAWNRPETQARWRQFLLDEQQRSKQTGPVRRRPVTSEAPADVILLRDHFAAVAGGIVGTGTFLFAFLALLVRGSVKRRNSIS